MAEENVTPHGSVRIRGTYPELNQVRAWCEEMDLRVSVRDLYDRWSTEHVWAFDFDDGKEFLMFYVRWQDKVCGKQIW